MDPLTHYFHAEKTESLVFVGAGIAGSATALIWWVHMSFNILSGAGWPLFLIGLIQSLAGLTVYLRTNKQVAALQSFVTESPDAFRIEELDRMHRVSQNFIRVRWLLIALFITSGIMILTFFPLKGFWFGFAVALAFESAISLAFDFFAEERADHYREFVRRVG